LRFPNPLSAAVASADDAAEFELEMVPDGGDRDTVNPSAWTRPDFTPTHHASWRQVVDLGDADGAVGVHPPGQSANPASPHFADQLPLWRDGVWHPKP